MDVLVREHYTDGSSEVVHVKEFAPLTGVVLRRDVASQVVVIDETYEMTSTFLYTFEWAVSIMTLHSPSLGYQTFVKSFMH